MLLGKYVPDIFRVMSGKRISRKRAVAIMCRQYIVQFHLGTTRLLGLIYFLLAVERAQQIIGRHYIVYLTIQNGRYIIIYIYIIYVYTYVIFK